MWEEVVSTYGNAAISWAQKVSQTTWCDQSSSRVGILELQN